MVSFAGLHVCWRWWRIHGDEWQCDGFGLSRRKKVRYYMVVFGRCCCRMEETYEVECVNWPCMVVQGWYLCGFELLRLSEIGFGGSD